MIVLVTQRFGMSLNSKISFVILKPLGNYFDAIFHLSNFWLTVGLERLSQWKPTSLFC